MSVCVWFFAQFRTKVNATANVVVLCPTRMWALFHSVWKRPLLSTWCCCLLNRLHIAEIAYLEHFTFHTYFIVMRFASRHILCISYRECISVSADGVWVVINRNICTLTITLTFNSNCKCIIFIQCHCSFIISWIFVWRYMKMFVHFSFDCPFFCYFFFHSPVVVVYACMFGRCLPASVIML